MKNIKRSSSLAFCILALSAASSSGCDSVEPGNVGVQTRFGSVINHVDQPGLYFTGFNDMHTFGTRIQTYTMAGASSMEQGGEGAIHALTRDSLPVTVECSVTFHLNGDHAVLVFSKLGDDYANRLIHPSVRSSIRNAISELTMQQLIDQRAELQNHIQTLVTTQLTQTLTSQHVPTNAIVVDAILLRDIDLPESIDEAIAQVQRARQLTAQRQQELLTAQQEAQAALTRAQGEANANLARVDGNAQAALRMARANAEANAILARSLTPELLQLNRQEVMRAVLASNRTTTVFVPTGTAPTIMMPQAAQQ